MQLDVVDLLRSNSTHDHVLFTSNRLLLKIGSPSAVVRHAWLLRQAWLGMAWHGMACTAAARLQRSRLSMHAAYRATIECSGAFCRTAGTTSALLVGRTVQLLLRG